MSLYSSTTNIVALLFYADKERVALLVALIAALLISSLA